jgi:hypothetical protein
LPVVRTICLLRSERRDDGAREDRLTPVDLPGKRVLVDEMPYSLTTTFVTTTRSDGSGTFANDGTEDLWAGFLKLIRRE